MEPAMNRNKLASCLLLILTASGSTLAQQSPVASPPRTLAQRIVPNDPSKYATATHIHEGPGQLHFRTVLRAEDVDAPLVFVHRGVLDAKSGIGQHFHNECEEMFVILDGEAEFTIDGRTSVLKGPAGAPVRAGHSHALYNPTDRPLQWMNINVGMINSYDAFDLGDPHTGAPIDPIPQFMTLRLDRALLREQDRYHGGVGKILYRRALGPTVFTTPWSYVDHVLIPPGASIGPQSEAGMGEVYYVLAGAGTVTLNGESARIKADDTIPFKPDEPKTLSNSGHEPLELMVIGVAHDMAVKHRYLEASAQPAGRVGR